MLTEPVLTHDWTWGDDGRPCCVRCGTLARCEDAENTVARAVAAEARVEALEAQRDSALKALTTGCDDVDCHDGCRDYPWRKNVLEARRILSGDGDA